jgi:antitoxin component YwqK of YwqJK toxin-antitoxin module
VVRFHTAVLVLTWAAACGSGGAAPKGAPVEPPAPAVAQAVDAAPLPDTPPPPKLVCDGDTAPMPAPAPEPTWSCARPDGTRHGRFIALFPDGSIELEGAYEDGVLDGPWRRNHPGGAVAEQGAYAAGKKTGRWVQSSPAGAVLGEYELVAGTGLEKRWYDSGALYSEIALKDGARHGHVKIYEPDGTPIESARYVNGVLDGARAAGTVQTLRIEETFSAGVRTGARKIWQAGIPLAEERFDRRGRHHGAYTLWRSRRVARLKGQYAHGKRSGEWIWRAGDNKKEREGSYVDGKRDGWWFEWWNDRLVFSGAYTAGKPDGEFTYYDYRGNELGKFTIHGGTGTMTTFHANRKPSSHQRLRKGVEDGPHQELTPRGKVVVQGTYRGGAKHGTWKEWTPDGVLLHEQSWKRGKLDGSVKKYVDGKLSVQSTYAEGKAEGPYVELRHGKPAVTGQFAADRRTGTWTHRAPDGSVVLVATYRDGILDGPWRQLTGDAVLEGNMVAGRRAGTWTVTDKAGAVRTLTYGPP